MNDQLDKRVLYSFAAVIALIIFFLLFRLGCRQEITIQYKIPDTVFVGSKVPFEDLTLNATQWEWDFGDSQEYSFEKTAEHVYSKPATYNVNLLINEKYSLQKKIVVINRPEEITINTELKPVVAKTEVVKEEFFPTEITGKKNVTTIKETKKESIKPKPIVSKVIIIPNPKTHDIIPKALTGDEYLSGDIAITGNVELKVSADSTTIYGRVYAWFKEKSQNDPTKYGINGLKEGNLYLYTAPPSKKIHKVPSSLVQFGFESSPKRSSQMTKEFSNFVKFIEITGDKKGGVFQPKHKEFKFTITFDNFEIELEER